MTTFIFLFLIAILFYILGRKDEIKRCNKELTNLLSYVSKKTRSHGDSWVLGMGVPE